MTDPRDVLKQNQEFQSMPERIKDWILASPNAAIHGGSMLREQPSRNRLAVSCLLALSLAACSTAQLVAAEPRDIAVSKDAVTVENLLRWPLEGPKGVERVVSGIEATFKPADRTTSMLGFTQQEFRLGDGYLLSYRSVFKGPGASVTLGSEPCFSPSRAAEIIGAQPGPIIYDPDGADRGRIFRVIRNDVRIHVYTTPLTYRCVASIAIYALPRLANTSIIRNDVTLQNLLRWALEGQIGLNKVETGLHQVFQDMEPLPNLQFSSNGVAYLVDGTVLGFARISRLSGDFDIGLKQNTCLDPKPYAELIGAQDSVTLDAHGIDRGKTYSVRDNGVMVNIDTTPITYQCVTSIHIHRMREEAIR